MPMLNYMIDLTPAIVDARLIGEQSSFRSLDEFYARGLIVGDRIELDPNVNTTLPSYRVYVNDSGCPAAADTTVGISVSVRPLYNSSRERSRRLAIDPTTLIVSPLLLITSAEIKFGTTIYQGRILC